ncbi:hypothetical protein C2G38_2093414 [Gigaspora rosea]|uniref:Phosphatidylglycerol/phosphatidylinositol transfer protein n=1 Tax=Gigaspora rosea TaxID=44941 RepID=A0A397UYR4_9GLOM|nr:hypothetical protein C2G38_2093414 [Gigaspora rosea]
MERNFIFTFILLLIPFVINAEPCYHPPTPPLLSLSINLSNASDPKTKIAQLSISQKPDYNIYNDTKFVVEVYSEDDVRNKATGYIFELCALSNITCPFPAGNSYSAQTNFSVPFNTKLIAVSVSTEHDKYIGCEVIVFKNITIPTLTTSFPASTPHP